MFPTPSAGNPRLPSVLALALLCLPAALPVRRARALPPPAALQTQILLFLAVAPRTKMYHCLFLAQIEQPPLFRGPRALHERPAGCRRVREGRGAGGGRLPPLVGATNSVLLNPGIKNITAFGLGAMVQFQRG